MMTTVSVSTQQASVSERAKAERIKAILAALVLGFVLIYTVGFAASASVHNAAHDTRHGLAFPCH
jgi:cobalt transporter subunit CbtB